MGFLSGLGESVVIDEIQRAPELFVAIKADVDRNRKPGRYLLTGSANVLLLPRLSESLAGRMEIFALWPLSQGEFSGVREKFIDILFSENVPHQILETVDNEATLLERAIRGGTRRLPEELQSHVVEPGLNPISQLFCSVMCVT